MPIPVVAYVRVSRVGGRTGDSFLSPDLQLAECEREAKRSGLIIVDTLQEFDVSGGDKTRPKWNEAIRRVESGSVRGIVVWNLSRFSRSLVDAVAAIERIENAGGAVYSASGEAGDDTPTGRLTRNIFLALAEHERERARDGFAKAQASALDRGIWITSRIPLGYTRNPATRKLEIDPETAPVIVGLFERRAEGWSWNRLARWYSGNGGEPNARAGNLVWKVRNVSYLGHIRYGDALKRNAHPAIISQLLFDRANAVKGRKPEANGKLAGQTLLGGLVRCQSCGGFMQVASVGKGNPAYACRNPHCTARAAVKASSLEAEVQARTFAFMGRVEPPWINRPGNEAQKVAERDKTRKALEEATYDRKKFIGNRMARRSMSDEEYASELADLTATLEEAQIAYDLTESAEPELPTFVDFAAVYAKWTIKSRREFWSKFLSKVVVKPANRNSRLPIGERMAMKFNAHPTAGEYWLLPNGQYSGEPFGRPVSQRAGRVKKDSR